MQGCSQKINIPEVRQALKENHNIEIPASTIFIEENTIPLQMRYCFSTQRFQTLIKNKVEIKFAKNTANGNSRKAGCWHTVLLWLIKKSNNWGETRPEWGFAKMQDLLSVRIN
jgi:uncharacterized protein YbcC (UPF0753/DUF2309 family)